MKDKIILNIISDVVCPWCVVGYKRLEKALTEMGIQNQVAIEWEPFELNPNMSTEGENLLEHLGGKYGGTAESQKGMQDRLAELGAEVGFTFDFFDAMKAVNTRDAHVLLDYAKESGKQTELEMRYSAAYFTERKDISDREVLLQELQNIGLDADKGRARLNDSAARDAVREREKYWQMRGVSSVPTMVFNGKSALTGAQPVHVYKQVLQELMETA